MNQAHTKGINSYLGIQPSSEKLFDAEADFAKSSELKPQNTKYALALADIRASRFFRDLKSIAIFYKIESQPGLPTGGEFNISRFTEAIHNETDSINSAVKWSQIVVTFQPYPHQLLRHGILTFASGDYQKGIDLLSKAIDMQVKKSINSEAGKNGMKYPQVVSDLLVRASCYLLLENPSKALDDLNTAVEIWPHYADVYVFRAYLKKYLQDNAGAIQDLERAISQRPNWRGDYEKLIALYQSDVK